MKMSEKILRAIQYAQRVRSITESLKSEAKSYDCTWPNSYITSLEVATENILKLL